MIRGYFNRSCPHVAAQLAIPCIQIQGPVIFVLDTGADETVLMPNEAIMLGVDYSKLVGQPRGETCGLGGDVEAFAVPASVIFKGGRYRYDYKIKLLIIEKDLDNEWTLSLPSVLGRDVLNRMRSVYDLAKNSMTMTPMSWSRRFK